jgi:hypothetical protein
MSRQLSIHHSPLTTHHSLRPGKTLIEVAVIVALTGVALSLATTTLVTLFRVERQLRADAAYDLAQSRLAIRWRADVHAAVAAKADGDCQLILADGRSIHYTFQSPAIRREVRRGETIEHRDSFVIPRSAQASFSSDSQQGGLMVRLAITAPSQPDHPRLAALHPLTVAAALNLHRQPADAEGQP